MTTTTNVAVAVFALVSVAEQRTRVRLGTLKRLPGRGLHVTATFPSTSSVAATL
jgi:hypothetical protein